MLNYEYDKDYPFAAFITNLGKYNEGELVGKCVSLDELNYLAVRLDEMTQTGDDVILGRIDEYECET